jgi:hypothetical protein
MAASYASGITAEAYSPNKPVISISVEREVKSISLFNSSIKLEFCLIQVEPKRTFFNSDICTLLAAAYVVKIFST